MSKVKHLVIKKTDKNNEWLKNCNGLVAWVHNEHYWVIGRWGTNKTELRKYLPKEK